MLSMGILLALSACDTGNSSTWSMSTNVRENRTSDSFTISVGTARSGTRNVTFELTADELASLNVISTSESGEIILVISQDGRLDGTEIRIDISNFSGAIPASELSAGLIRFSLQYDTIRDSNTVISWGNI